jgi:hypothetical protein
MESRVTVRTTNEVYWVTLPIEEAHDLVASLRRSWLNPVELNELHLANGTTVTVNPRYITAVEVT